MCVKTLIIPDWATTKDIAEMAKFASMFVPDTKIELCKHKGTKMFIVNDKDYYGGEESA